MWLLLAFQQVLNMRLFVIIAKADSVMKLVFITLKTFKESFGIYYK